MIKLLSIIFISCLGIIVYSNTFHCSFHFDDGTSIINNLFIQNISDLQKIWDFRPSRFITYLSFAFNYHFNQLDVFGYHVFNLIVHLISAGLVWWLTLLTLSTPAMKEVKLPKKSTTTRHADLIALFAGLIFVSHPLQTEAVTYIVQRAASMAAMFYLAALCFYVKSRSLEHAQSRSALRGFYYACSFVAATAAMFTKEMTISLPFVILLYEFSFLKTKKSINWGYVIPFLLTLFIIPLTTLLTSTPKALGVRGTFAETPPDISSMQYLLTQFRVILTYIRLVFLPLNQNLDYDYAVSHNLFELPVLFSLALLIIILFFTIRLFSKYRLLVFSILFFFITLLPESSVFPIKDVIFEHRLYLPIAGYSLLLAGSIYYFPQKNIITAIIIALTMLTVCNSVLTYQRNKVWRDDFILWDDTVSKSPHKARDYNNRAIAYEAQGKIIKAISDYDKAIEVGPKYSDSYYNRAGLYAKDDNFSQAISDYTKAIEVNPQYPDAYNNRGFIYYKEGKLAQALSDYNNAIGLNPYFIKAYVNRASVYNKEGDFAQAILDYNKANELDPANKENYPQRGDIYANAYNDRGNVYYKSNNFNQAIVEYNKAIEMKSDFAVAYINRGLIYNDQGNFIQARYDFTKAIAINPAYAQAYNDRGLTYAQQNKFDQAFLDFDKAIEINPNYAETYNNRGILYNKEGRFPLAMSDYNKAIELNPRFALAYNNRAITYFYLKEYDKVWEDVDKVEELGSVANPALIRALKKVSGGT